VGVNQGSWGNAAPVYSGTPQFSSPRLAADLGFSYRVVVNDSSPTAQQRIRSVVPDAFRTVVNGQVVMQAGLFRDRPAAEAMIQRLSQSNLPATVVAVN
jgi:N-acetylmuramoyl-L-alanine amidase